MMSLREIPFADRHAIGEAVYAARQAPMTWIEAFRSVLGRERLPDCHDAISLYVLPREYALRTGKPWPPVMPEGWRARAPAPPARDWLILTDGPARFASELPAPA